jgi:hypothetical protein
MLVAKSCSSDASRYNMVTVNLNIGSSI